MNIDKSFTLSNIQDNDAEFEIESDGDENLDIVKPYDPTLIRVDPKSFSLRNVLDMIADGDLDLAPDFQRMKVWTTKQKSRLIESILLRIPLPAFYFSSDSNGYMQVVDGVQRLSTINDFVRNNGFPLQHLEYLDKELGGKYFNGEKGIENTVWGKRINTTQIIVNVIDPQTPSRVKFDIFKRINTGGTPLNAQEIRHCMSGNRSRELLLRLTSLNSFNLATNERMTGHIRMADRELALRWVAFTLLDLGQNEDITKYDSLEDLLNLTANAIDENNNINLDELVSRFNITMHLSHIIFEGEAFRKSIYKTQQRFPINKALFEAWGVSLGKYIDHADELIHKRYLIQAEFRKLCSENYDFINSITVGTGDPRKVYLRHEEINSILERVLNEQ